MSVKSDTWSLGGRTFQSRIIVGTGKYASLDQTRAALDASGSEMVTVALRRIDFSQPGPSLLDAIDRSKYVLLPNTAGCYTAEDAVRVCRLARELGMDEFVKLEVIGDPKTLFPDNAATVDAARQLVAEGFQVLPYCGDDLVTCKRLVDAGCLAVMPLAAPIGSGLGIRNPHNIRLIIENVEVPAIYAGVPLTDRRARAQKLLSDLFAAYMTSPGLLPSDWGIDESSSDLLRGRAVCDYIAGMTDGFAQQEYRRIFHTDYRL